MLADSGFSSPGDLARAVPIDRSNQLAADYAGRLGHSGRIGNPADLLGRLPLALSVAGRGGPRAVPPIGGGPTDKRAARRLLLSL